MDRPRPKAVKRCVAVTPLGDRRCLLSRRLLPRIRYEQALAETALAVFPDQSLGLGSDQEVGQCLTADDIDAGRVLRVELQQDRKSTRLNSSHSQISYAVFCLKKKQ